jgi:hypothetical protein
LFHATFSPDGSAIAIAGFKGASALWSAPGPAEGSVAELRHRVERITGLLLKDNGSPSAMGIEAWQKLQSIVHLNLR